MLIKAEDDNHLIFASGINIKKTLTFDLNLMYTKIEGSTGGYAYYGPYLGAEIFYNKSNSVFAPKIGYVFAGMLLCFRISELNYIYDKKIDGRILPEIGLDFLGFGNICYGYNMHIMGTKYVDIPNHQFKLTLHLLFFNLKTKKFYDM